MSATEQKKKGAYDKYVNWKLFIIPVVLCSLLLVMPTPNSMKDVAVEYKVGPKAVVNLFSKEIFGKPSGEVEQWQILGARIMEAKLSMGAMTKKQFMQVDQNWTKRYKIDSTAKHLEMVKAYFEASVADDAYAALMQKGLDLRRNGLKYEDMKDNDLKNVDKGAWAIKVAVAIIIFVVLCFVTECIPLPSVAFCIGLILVFSGVVSRSDVAGLYWDDAVWFIMGSLMFAAAFVKTGVDKRVCLMMFKKLAVPDIKWITLVFFVVMAPLSAFISDHALTAMFLPIAMLLYQNSLTDEVPEDLELAKMLMITIAMAPNIGGPGAPSGGARNVIMMTYLKDMFGVDIGYFQWVTYCMPFVFVLIPVTWMVTNWRFKPKIKSLAPAMATMQKEIERMGGWNSKQIMALIIFVVMVFGWFTEQSLFDYGILPVRLGIGVIAVAGAVAYLLAGVVTWRDYQEKVDWGVVWLYAGAIIFGRTLDSTGAAYWVARSALEFIAPLGINSGVPLMLTSNGLTAVITQFMADGPAAAAVGPIVLNMGALAHPGTAFLPFTAMATAIASSFAYCLIIGTPPNAIVYSSGYLTAKDFFRVGLPMWVIANVVLALMIKFYWAFRGFGVMPGF